MAKRKDLYKAKNLKDLNSQVHIPLDQGTIKSFQNIMSNCYSRALTYIESDEEAAYILLMRYFDCYEMLKKNPDGRKWLNTVNKELLSALARLEELKASLTDRYDQLNKPTERDDKQPPLKDVLPRAPINNVVSDESVSDEARGWISSSGLVNLLRERCNVLLIDIRSAAEFASCSIKHAQLLNVPGDVYLKPGVTFTKISSLFATRATEPIWNARGECKRIILLDSSSGKADQLNAPVSNCLLESHPLIILKGILLMWDAKSTVKIEPLILDGGMQDFLLRYAPLTTNPQCANVNSVTHGDYSCQIDYVEYPNVSTLQHPIPRFPVLPDHKSRSTEDGDIGTTRVLRKPRSSSTSARTTTADARLPFDYEDRLRQLRLKKPTLRSSSSELNLNANEVDKVPHFDRSRKPASATKAATSAHLNLNHPLLPDDPNVQTKPPLSSSKESSIEGAVQPLPPIDHSALKPSTPARFDRSRRLSNDDVRPHSFNASLSNGTKAEPPKNSGSSTHSTFAVSSDHSSKRSEKNINDVKPVIPSTIQLPSCLPRPLGLRNRGNTCYMNAALQPLVHTRALVTFFLRGLDNNYTNSANPLGYGGEVSTHFQRLFLRLWCGPDQTQALDDFRQVVGKHRPSFATTEQQDSLEFLLFLLDGLHEDMNLAHSQSQSSKAQDNQSDVELEHLVLKKQAGLAWEAYLCANESVIVSSFQGQLLSSIQCCPCKKASLKFEAFVCLTLPLPNQSVCNIQDCVELFGRAEQLTGSSQWSCPRCNTRTDALKKIELWRLPNYLIVHMKRFQLRENTWRKLETNVQFPIDMLDPKTFTREPQTDKSHYSLYAVLNHRGTMESGHYTSYCRGVSDDSWYAYDDSHVHPIDHSQIQSSSAYILFYERLPRIKVFSEESI